MVASCHGCRPGNLARSPTGLLRWSALALGVALLAAVCAAGAKPACAEAGGPVVRVVCFVPADRQPAPGYAERLDRVMTEVQRFYRVGMEAAGYGPMTFDLERDEAGKLRIYLVQGREPSARYGRNASDAVRSEVREALLKEGVDLNRETAVLFQVLLAWDGARAVEVGPYCGGGGPAGGTAWVYDDERLDPRLLPSREPGGFYGRPCSLGEFNSHYVGGVAHELGHGFGLPHDCEADADRTRGLSIMGGGNHTYGRELRGEGVGAFLSAASAAVLARHPCFVGHRVGGAAAVSRFRELRATREGGALVIEGRVEARPEAFAMVAYNDVLAVPADYDAVGWVAPVRDGAFRIQVKELKPGRMQLRLRCCHANGAGSWASFDYTVDAQGAPDLSPWEHAVAMRDACDAFREGRLDEADRLARQIEHSGRGSRETLRQAAHLAHLCHPEEPRAAAGIPADVASVPVSALQFRRATVGWGQPYRDRVLVEGAGTPFLRVDGRFFERGLYAHAPSRYEVDLGGAWKRLRSGYGLQDGAGGSVLFVVRGDGRELFRSAPVRDGRLRAMEVPLAGIKTLELLVEDGGDGPNSDWGIWIEPVLER